MPTAATGPPPVALSVTGAPPVSPSRVPPSALLPPKDDARDRGTPEYMAWERTLTADIGKRGVRSPIHVIREGNAFRVLTGETRRRCALLAGVADVPIIVHDAPLTEAEQRLEMLLENEMRSGFTDLERAVLYQQLMLLNGWSQVELARAVGKSQGAISKALTVSKKLPDDLQAMVSSGKLCPSSAAAIARLDSQEAMREVAGKAVADNLKRDVVESLCAQKMGKRKPSLRKGIKGRTPKGVVYVLPALDLEALAAELSGVVEALKKAQKLGLDLSAVPSLFAK
jgi:ParB family transcriptional regulator, chromosome partitioning protein